MLDLTTQTFAAVLRLAAPMDPPASVDVPAPIELPAPVAWLQDQDDHPLVSRTLLVLDPGEPDPRAVLAPLLWCFDAADHQRVAWLGDRLVVNGPVARSRPMPNVSMPIQVVDAVEGGPTRVEDLVMQPRTPDIGEAAPEVTEDPERAPDEASTPKSGI